MTRTCFTRRRFFAPDPFIFLEQNGKRTIVLSDLEIDRGAQAGEGGRNLSFSQLEREVQGTQKEGAAF